MKNPPADLAQRLLDVSEHVLHTDPPLRLEDVAQLVGASRATLYYYFSGREDLLAFLLTAHSKQGAQAVQTATTPGDPPESRLRAMVSALAEYLGHHPGTCAGLLGAVGASGRMSEVLAANDTWIAGPLRDLLAEGRKTGAFDVDNVADAANTMLGGLLLGVLGRSMAGADATDPTFRALLTEQTVRGVLTR
ncbi:TetR/AcrR family transcriptional regulator [Nonomuraea turcica]|uniref:TetR/AcrR family transcriptional regulator n=1 Tax=Nonomuraea sp. G32 TaxID=3067274 RepID=UPI00273A88D2|nr:TetR/AcrR family transcriptional regulator [Nonomuraea sp. G32]MDP4503738.1 TetR/AcrR family transcriptional regulator [Nonomuraea sp. G32]